jgi:hypothetical protein
MFAAETSAFAAFRVAEARSTISFLDPGQCVDRIKWPSDRPRRQCRQTPTASPAAKISARPLVLWRLGWCGVDLG